MEILYFGKLGDNFILEEKIKKKLPYFIAQYNYEKALVDELKTDTEFNLELISIYQTEYYPNDKIVINKNNHKEDSKFYYTPIINLPFFREASYFVISFIKIIIWNIRTLGKQRAIYSSTHFPPVSLAIVLAGKLFGIFKIVTFTDLSLFSYSKKRIMSMPLYKKIVMKPYLRLVNWLQTSYDGYVLFSKQMNEVVNKRNKPFCVIEGIYNPTVETEEMQNIQNKYNKEFIIMHAGTLNKEVGIDKILEVFQKLQGEHFKLILIGNGDMVDEIKEQALVDSRIKYLGFMSKEEVFSNLKKADLLINLRNPDDIYTQYSFPSKMFEYMASGTPVFTTKLKGMPNEYYDYVVSIDGFSTPKIVEKITEISNVRPLELQDLGQSAKKFILTKKTKGSQVNKIKNFIFKRGDI